MEKSNTPSLPEIRLQEIFGHKFDAGNYDFFSAILKKDVHIEIREANTVEQFIFVRFEDEQEYNNTSIRLIQSIIKNRPTVVATNCKAAKSGKYKDTIDKTHRQYFTGQGLENPDSLSLAFLNQLADVVMEIQEKPSSDPGIAC